VLVPLCVVCAGTAEVLIRKVDAITWEMHPINDPTHITTQSTEPVNNVSGARPRLSIEDGWREYERMILDPQRAGIGQRMESRRLWYAACSFFLDTLSHSLDAGTSDSTENDEAYMQTVHAEIQHFAKMIQEGVA
jgi:hypothetical protein